MFQWGLACCAIEMGAALAGPRYDVMRLGVIPFPASPRQADLIVISGTVTDKMAPAIKRLYEQMPDPKYVISMGSCANCGGPYWDSYSVTKGVDQIIPVDVYVPGCPPRPEAFIQGIVLLQQRIMRRRPGRAWRGEHGSRSSLVADAPPTPRDRRGARGRVADPRCASRPADALLDDSRPSSATRSSSTTPLFGDVVVRVRRDAWRRRPRRSCKDELGCDYLSFIVGHRLDAHARGRRGRLGRHVDARRSRRRRPTASPGRDGRFQVFARRRVDQPQELARDPEDRRRPTTTCSVESWVSVYPGADWHEREAWEMYGFVFDGHPSLRHLYLPVGVRGSPAAQGLPAARARGEAVAGPRRRRADAGRSRRRRRSRGRRR